MRKTSVIATVLALSAAFTPARAAVNVVVTPPGAGLSGFVPPVVVLSKSAPATYVNLDSLGVHDVTAVAERAPGVPMFASATIPAGQTAEIKRLATTPVGEYAFICSIHTGMMGTARVVE